MAASTDWDYSVIATLYDSNGNLVVQSTVSAVVPKGTVSEQEIKDIIAATMTASAQKDP